MLNQYLGLYVHSARRVVQDQDARVEQQRTRNGDTLLLAAAQRRAALAHRRVVAFGEAENKVMRGGGLRGCNHFLVTGIWPAKGNVVADRTGEEVRLLQHDADLGAE